MQSSEIQPSQSDDETKTRLERIYDLKAFDTSDHHECIPMNEVKKVLNKTSRTLKERKQCAALLKKRVPILDWLPKYKLKSYILSDAMSGLTVGIMNIPQGLAYALLATLNPIYGLYVSFFPIIVYMIFGTCKHLIIGECIYEF